MPRNIVQTDTAPAAVGPYSQAVIANGFVFTSGQIALLPGGGDLLNDDVQAQTRQVLSNMRAVLEAAGSSLENVVKVTVFLADMNDFQAMNAVYGEFFSAPFPARSTFQVAKLPRAALVEIECVAALG
jgi:2-iminobutanoate/2-iminopropanoate deaminase